MNWRSLFFEEDESKDKKEAKQVAKPTQATRASKPQSTASSPKVTASAGKVSAKFTDILLKAMEANNPDGFDYMEFKQSLKSLEKMPMDEGTRYKSAFAMAQTMGATPDKLIKTANHYIRVLLAEQDKFNQALTNQRTKQIGDKEGHIKQLDNLIKEKTNKIEQLKNEIAEHQKGMEALKSEISEAVVKVEGTKNDFQASFNNLVSKIKKDIEAMQKHLK